jgi:hypothetical protein
MDQEGSGLCFDPWIATDESSPRGSTRSSPGLDTSQKLKNWNWASCNPSKGVKRLDGGRPEGEYLAIRQDAGVEDAGVRNHANLTKL